MQLLILCLTFACALAALTPEQIQRLEPISKECRSESGLSVEKVSKLRNKVEFEDDPKLRKHAVCLCKKTGLITDSGDIAADTLREKLKKAGASDGVVDEILSCGVRKSTVEETVMGLMKCVYDRVPNFSAAD